MSLRANTGSGGITLRDAIDLPARGDAFLITLLHHVRSEPSPKGIHLHLDISGDLPAIVGGAGQRALLARVGGLDRSPITKWKQRARAGNAAEYHSDCLPLRWASGGVLAVVAHRRVDHFALSYRNIDPHGWNLYVGHAGGWDDLLDVERVLEREFREEALIHNKADNVVYAFALSDQRFDANAFQAEALARWGLSECRSEALACQVARGPDSVTVTAHRGNGQRVRHVSDGLFVVIDPVALGIECMRIVRIPLPDALDLQKDVIFLDGELHGDGLLDSAIGLLDIKRCKQWIAGGRQGDLPVAHIYQSGRHLSGGIADSKKIRDDWEHRNDFCPVTAEMIARHWPAEPQGST